MDPEQFNELINVVSQLRENSFNLSNFVIDVLIPISSAVFAAVGALYVAKFQINKSEEQQKIQRKEELKKQKQFLIEELKINSTEKLLESNVNANRNIINMVDLGYKKHANYLKNRMKDYTNSSEIFQINSELQKNSDQLQNYLSDLFTFVNLFDVDRDLINIEDLNTKINDFYKMCFDADSVGVNDEDSLDKLSFNLYTTADIIIKVIDKIDDLVRSKQIALIKAMQLE